MLKFVILIPAYNEEKTIKKILNKISKFNVFIVNDCSKDRTLDICEKYKNVKIITNKKNIGYENSLYKGFKALVKKNFDYIITMDADGEHSVSNIKKVSNYCKNNLPDLIVGNRSRKNRLLEIVISVLFYLRFKIKDPLSGFKVYNIKTLKNVIKNHKIEKFYFIDILKLFINCEKKISTINIISNSKPKRKTKTGNIFFSSIKILFCFKYLI